MKSFLFSEGVGDFSHSKANSKTVFLAMMVLAVTKNDIFWRFLKGGANFGSLYLGNCLSYRSGTSPIGLGSKNSIFIDSYAK